MSSPESLAAAREYARLAREFVRALGTGDELGAARLLEGLSQQDTIGVLVQTGQIVVVVQRGVPGLTMEDLVRRLEQGVQE